MITDAEIIAIYLRAEKVAAQKAAEWHPNADECALCMEVAHLLQVPYTRVLDVMSAHWTCGGAG